MPKIFSSFCPVSMCSQKKKERSSRRCRHRFLQFYVDFQKKGSSSEFCNFSPRFVRHTRARCCEPQLSTIFGGKQKRRFLAGEKTPKFEKFQCENAGKNFALFCAYREHWLTILLNTNTVAYSMQNYKPNRLAPMVYLMLVKQ